ncbi:hypothetical protein B0A48_02038 [Cryoendolithus antarcticus]|uniref:Rhodopsin domain-containing protein n=1 Tax=Cryoendolithus antarcticus TaxID=1507870 RepID=A0A1V8TMI5_9PEZI|nr:hypothetical protein B0A48_02038 [Cryoendolithus antarcticus]
MPGNLPTVPLSVIAAWPTANYVNPERRGWMPVFAGLLQATCTMMVLTRLWLRWRSHAGSLGLDDSALVPAWLFSVAFTVLTLLGTEKYGSDRHVWDVPFSLYEGAARGAWLSEQVFLIASCCSKVSILLFYRRLTTGTYARKWKFATIAAIYFTILYAVALVLSLFLGCNPIEAYWKYFDLNWHEPYKCKDFTFFNPLSGCLSVVGDLYSVILPVLMTRRLDAPRRQKIALNIIFSLGLVVVFTGAMRTYYLTRLGREGDLTWIGFSTFIWSQLELNLSLMCASAPALRVFFRRYLSETFHRTLTSARSARAMRQHNNTFNTHTTISRPGTASSIRREHSRQDGEAAIVGSAGKGAHLSAVEEVEDEYYGGGMRIGNGGKEVLVRTPEEYEMYVLGRLGQNKPLPRAPSGRRADEMGKAKGRLDLGV